MSNCIQDIALCHRGAHQKDHRQLTWGETLLCRWSFVSFVLLLNEWGDVENHTLESIHLKWDCTDSICHKINMTFLQAAMSRLCFPQGKRRECTYVCERGCMSARNPGSCWLVTGPFPAPIVGGRLWSCWEKNAYSIGFEEECWGRGTWQGVAEAQCFAFLTVNTINHCNQQLTVDRPTSCFVTFSSGLNLRSPEPKHSLL